MAEGSETPGEPQRPSERDLLAERRARRAVDLEPSPSAHAEDALIRRAEAAEATVQALETHLTSLQQRVHEAAEERAGLAERLAAEQALIAEREHELRRVKQREYAEQQLRVEAEDRRAYSEADSRAEIDRLTRRLSASEHHARELAERLESAQRELDEAVQDVAAELAELRSAAAFAEQRSSGERELRLRLAELERRALEIHREVDIERLARERAESQLEEMRAGYRRMELLVAELRSVVGQLRTAATRSPGVERAAVPAVGGEQREELADALAAAVERLRARAEAAAAAAEVDSAEADSTDPAAGESGAAELVRPSPASSRPEPARVPIAALEDPPSELVRQPTEPVLKPAPHKHSMSLVARARLRRKQRRERRSDAAAPPTMKPS
jgi:chromosome segregation ATPase